MTGGAALYASVLSARGPDRGCSPGCSYVQRLVAAGATRSATSSASADAAAAAGPVGSRRPPSGADGQGERGAARYESCRPRSTRRAPSSPRCPSERGRCRRPRTCWRRSPPSTPQVDARGRPGRRCPAPARSRRCSRSLYVAAAKTCPGMSWTLLAAIGQVESGHGANPGTSYAGAQGPMQFMPSTFASYGVDGDEDGDRDIMDPADAVFSAAHYLCAQRRRARRRGAGPRDLALQPRRVVRAARAEAGRPVRRADPQPQARLTLLWQQAVRPVAPAGAARRSRACRRCP